MENKELNVNDLDDRDKNRKSFSFRFAKTIIRILSRKPRFKYACPRRGRSYRLAKIRKRAVDQPISGLFAKLYH